MKEGNRVWADGRCSCVYLPDGHLPQRWRATWMSRSCFLSCSHTSWYFLYIFSLCEGIQPHHEIHIIHVYKFMMSDSPQPPDRTSGRRTVRRMDLSLSSHLFIFMSVLNRLLLVPHRLLTQRRNRIQTYDFIVSTHEAALTLHFSH